MMDDASIFRFISVLSTCVIANMVGASGSAVIAIAVSFLITFCLDFGHNYEEGETNFGVGMLVAIIAILVFLIFTPLIAYGVLSRLNKNSGIPVKPGMNPPEMPK